MIAPSIIKNIIEPGEIAPKIVKEPFIPDPNKKKESSVEIKVITSGKELTSAEKQILDMVNDKNNKIMVIDTATG